MIFAAYAAYLLIMLSVGAVTLGLTWLFCDGGHYVMAFFVALIGLVGMCSMTMSQTKAAR